MKLRPGIIPMAAVTLFCAAAAPAAEIGFDDVFPYTVQYTVLSPTFSGSQTATIPALINGPEISAIGIFSVDLQVANDQIARFNLTSLSMPDPSALYSFLFIWTPNLVSPSVVEAVAGSRIPIVNRSVNPVGAALISFGFGTWSAGDSTLIQISAVPEPSTMLLLIPALFGIACGLRRRWRISTRVSCPVAKG